MNPAEVAKEIGRFTLDGLSARVKRYDAATGEVLLRGDSFEDLADYLPALIAAGDIDVVRRQVDRAVAALGGGRSMHASARSHGIALCRAYDQSDLIFGLLLASMLDGAYLAPAGMALATWRASFLDPPRMARLDRVPGFRTRLPLRMSPGVPVLAASDHGMFIELFALYAELSNDASAGAHAVALLERFLATGAYRQRCIFPFYEGTNVLGRWMVRHLAPLAKRDGEFQLLKENSNIMFGVLRLCSTGPDEDRAMARQVFEQTVGAWRQWAFSKQHCVFLTNVNHRTGQRAADLTCFHAIDLLVAAAAQLEQPHYLRFAEQIAHGFLPLQDDNTGLIPFLHPAFPICARGMRVEPGTTWLDSAVDFGVSLCRLSQATGDKTYSRCAERLARGIEAHHHLQNGWASSVRVADGRTVDPVYSLKMSALVAKLFMALDAGEVLLRQDCLEGLLLQDR